MYEFDLKTFLRVLKNSRKRILLNCLWAIVVALIVGFSIPKQYVSQVTLAPEVNSENANLAGNLSSLASMAGMNLGNSVDAIGPDLYPDVVYTNDFLVDIIYTQVETREGESMTYEEYLKQERFPWWTLLFKLPAKALRQLLPQDEFFSPSSDGRINPQRVSRDEEDLLERMRDYFVCKISDKTGVITLSVRSQDPLVSQMMVDTLRVHLQSFITDYRTAKARKDLEHYQTVEAETREAFDEATKAYASYCDVHVNTIFQAYISERDRLENEMQVTMNAYNQMKQQRLMAEAKVQEDTPAFTVLEASAVANRHAAPKKMILLLAFVFIASLGTVLWYYVKLLFCPSSLISWDNEVTE